MELFSSRGGKLHGVELQFTSQCRANYSTGELNRLYPHYACCVLDFLCADFLNWIWLSIQEMGDGSVLLRLAHLYEVKSFDLMLYLSFY